MEEREQDTMMEPADRLMPLSEHGTLQERRAFAPLRSDLHRLLDTFALVDGLPSRRGLDPELRESVRAARVAVARVLLVLNRMEGQGDGSSEEIPLSWLDGTTGQPPEE